MSVRLTNLRRKRIVLKRHLQCKYKEATMPTLLLSQSLAACLAKQMRAQPGEAGKAQVGFEPLSASLPCNFAAVAGR